MAHLKKKFGFKSPASDAFYPQYRHLFYHLLAIVETSTYQLIVQLTHTQNTPHTPTPKHTYERCSMTVSLELPKCLSQIVRKKSV